MSTSTTTTTTTITTFTTEQDARDEIGYYLYDTLEARWFESYRSMHGLTPGDVIPGRCGGVSVKQWVTEIVRAERDKIDELGVDAWWAYELDPTNMFEEEYQDVLRMQQPPRPPDWLDPWEECPECDMCGGRHRVSEHHTAMMLCETCVDSNFSGKW